MKISVIGAGLIGCERIAALKRISEKNECWLKSITVFDPDVKRLELVEHKYSVKTRTKLEDVFVDCPDWVFICTPHDLSGEILKLAFKSGADVLLEKPLGRTLEECESLIALKPADSQLQIGFNYRFYKGIALAITDALNGIFGRLISVSLLLGHGNSPGMENSWKLHPERCGFSSLLDPGVHAIDLLLLLGGGNLFVEGATGWSGFWNTGIQEEAHVLLSNHDHMIFNLQTSLTHWRSVFRLEINGTDGYGVVAGRGRSYGAQSYRTGKRWGWLDGKTQADSELTILDDYNGGDVFYNETLAVLKGESTSHKKDKSMRLWPADYNDAHKVMQLLDLCRQKMKTSVQFQDNH